MKKSFFILGILIISMAGPNVLGANESSSNNEFGFDDLVQVIQTKHLQKIENVLPYLPKEMRSNFTLMHSNTNFGLQTADPMHPRVIMFTHDAKLTCAFVENSDIEANDTLECFQFRDKTRSFDFHEVVFPSAKNKLNEVAFSKPNQRALSSTNCTSCHAVDPKPNWEPYSTWPGTYGSQDDVLNTQNNLMVENLKESQNFLKFKLGIAGSKRYSQLDFGTGDFAPYSNVDKITNVRLRPNFRFLLAISQLTAQRNARLVEQKPLAEQIAFLSSLLNCPSTIADNDFLKKYFSVFEWTPAFRSLNPNCKDCDPSSNVLLSSYDYQGGFSSLNDLTGSILVQDLITKGVLPASMLSALLAEQNPGYARESFVAAKLELIPTLKILSMNNDSDLICRSLELKRIEVLKAR